MDMYFPVDLESAKAPVAIVAAGNVSAKIVGVCSISENLDSFPFGLAAQYYLVQYDGKHPMEVDISRVKIKVLNIVRQPEHGRLIMDESNPYGRAIYHPDEGYLGKDRVEAIVSVGEDIVKVIVHIVVQSGAVDQLADSEWNKFCPKGLYWKISQPSIEDYNDPANWYNATSLYGLLTGAKDALTGFADLSGSALGSTTNNKITLDTDAAGHTWFIEPVMNFVFEAYHVAKEHVCQSNQASQARK
jgi:hypothetical protein